MQGLYGSTRRVTKGDTRNLDYSYSQDYGPLLVLDSRTAPNTSGYQNRTLILASTHKTFAREVL